MIKTKVNKQTDPAKIFESKLIENEAFISSVPEQYLDKLTTTIVSDVSQGKQLGDIIDDIQKVYDVSDSRAKLIARTETGKINAALTQARCQSIGITQYVWYSAERDNTRDSHAAMNDCVIDYDNPPELDEPDGYYLPGEAPNCYCWSEAIILKDGEDPTIESEGLSEDESDRTDTGNISNETASDLQDEAE